MFPTNLNPGVALCKPPKSCAFQTHVCALDPSADRHQVVLAILLENFVSAQQQEDARESKVALAMIFEGDQDSGGIDDVLGEMIKFPSSIAMNKGIIRMFCFFDSREIGKIGFREIRHGMKKLRTGRICIINLEGYKRLMRGEHHLPRPKPTSTNPVHRTVRPGAGILITKFQTQKP